MSKETHKQEFRGTFLPSYIWDEFHQNNIDCQEMVLLSLIDSYIRNDKDCFASNAYLASKMSISERRIQAILGTLKKTGLVIQKSFDGRKRYLSTCFSHPSSSGQTRRIHHPCHDGSNTHIDKDYKKNNTLSLNKKTVQTENEIATPSSDHAKPKKSKHPRWKKYATRLAKAIQEVKKINMEPKISIWANSFRLLHLQDKVPIPRIREALIWYCQELQYQTQYLPVAHSGRAFREKFIKIEDARIRIGKNNKYDKNNKQNTETQKITLSKERAVQVKWLNTYFDNYNLVIPDDIPDFVAALRNWRNSVVKQMKAILGDDPRPKKTDWRKTYARLALEGPIPTIDSDTYLVWMSDQISSWNSWGGKIQNFYPGEKHFIRFVQFILKQQDVQWSKEMRGIMCDERE